MFTPYPPWKAPTKLRFNMEETSVMLDFKGQP